MSSLVSSTSWTEETLPVLGVAFMLMTPEPPRLVRRYSSTLVRLPKPFSVTERMRQGVMSLALGLELLLADLAGLLRRGDGEADDVVVLAEGDALDAVGGASHGCGRRSRRSGWPGPSWVARKTTWWPSVMRTGSGFSAIGTEAGETINSDKSSTESKWPHEKSFNFAGISATSQIVLGHSEPVKTVWRWTQSLANRSLAAFPC